MRVKCVYRYSNKVVWVYKARRCDYTLDSYKAVPVHVNSKIINETNELFNLDLLINYNYDEVDARVDKLFNTLF